MCTMRHEHIPLPTYHLSDKTKALFADVLVSHKS